MNLFLHLYKFLIKIIRQMFTKSSKNGKMANGNNNIDPTQLNQIKAGTIITGEIITEGLIRIDGKLNGNLSTAGKLFIGPTGEIIGDIKCKQADIEGKVEGKILVSDLLSLKSTANIKGEIQTQKLAIETGAVFNGTCAMTSSEKIKSSNAKPSTAKAYAK